MTSSNPSQYPRNKTNDWITMIGSVSCPESYTDLARLKKVEQLLNLEPSLSNRSSFLETQEAANSTECNNNKLMDPSS
ncbi:hypothetical protein WICPIJ_001667 [Wickerhamomyces pijperi]|uniref:Uncharacterized protein n=1 Tax=Wickerhamomyces pijperi TaxID=599730 RepID=A0A9P8QCX7_WICPI|nr:hypothetical protein WICPIJ_001667 [Wickerhamomyces pijperi]